MRLHQYLSLPLAVLALACSPNASDDKSKSESKRVAGTAGDTKAVEAVDAPAAAKGDKSAEFQGTDEAAQQEKIAEIQKRLKALETATAEETARWTDELKASAKALVSSDATTTEEMLDKIIASQHRRPGNAARDTSRHPKETLQFFGIDPDMTVIEVGPGAGWYTELLAPLLAKKGLLVVNSSDPEGPETESSIYYSRRTRDFLASNADLYGKVEVVIPSKPGEFELGKESYADAVLIVRGLHGAARRGELAVTLKEVSRVLKPGGILGIVQHRGTEGADLVKSAAHGYVAQGWLTKQVEAAGFSSVGASELNGNVKDNHEHPEGVWTLPPTLTLGDQDKKKYEAVGESDRMTLKFQKPA